MAGKHLEAAGLLAIEALLRPKWAINHIWGYIDRSYLLPFYQKRNSEQRRHIRPLDEAVASICGVDRSSVLEIIKKISVIDSDSATSTKNSSISPSNDGSSELQRLVSCLITILRPDTVVEVGVGRGATTRAILSSMEKNGKGHLYSIEFPALRFRYAQDIGVLVPNAFHGRWTLLEGPSQVQLPKLLLNLGRICLLVHDGAHSYYVQKGDYRAAVSHLIPGGVLISDDVNNDSFIEITEANRMKTFFIEQGKEDLIGIASMPLE